MAKPERERPIHCWLEVEDLLLHFDHFPHAMGIQRVCLEIYSELEREYGPAGRVGFCRLSLFTREFEQVDFSAILEKYLDPPGADAPWNVLASLARRGSKAAAFAKASRRLPRYLRRSIYPVVREWIGRRFRHRRAADFMRPGDIVVCLGAGWINRRYGRSIETAKRRQGVRFAVLIHDVIPLTRTDFIRHHYHTVFGDWVQGMLGSADLALTVSHYSLQDLTGLARRRGWQLPELKVLPLGADFHVRRPRVEGGASNATKELPERFVLYVSTIEPRKNHGLLIEAWRRLVALHGAASVPDLVWVGRFGGAIGAFRRTLMASDFIGGKLHILPDLSDAGVTEAYRRCLFTVFPSLYEGWGLPVAESLSHGKFCVASDRTSLPEVGGSFVDYFDPDDIEDVVSKIARPLFDPTYLAAREARLRAEYRPASWADCAHALVAALDQARPPGGGGVPVESVRSA